MSGGAGPAASGEREPTPTDEELESQHREIELDTRRAQLEREWDKLTTEKENRALRGSIATGALIVMLIQIAAANAIFVWYGDTNRWDISATAISAWLGSTVVQVVAVVLVIMNYLFPGGGPPEFRGARCPAAGEEPPSRDLSALFPLRRRAPVRPSHRKDYPVPTFLHSATRPSVAYGGDVPSDYSPGGAALAAPVCVRCPLAR